MKSVKTKVLAVAAAAALLVTGCSSGGEPTPTPNDTAVGGLTEMTDIVVAVQPIASYAALHVGVEQGFFEDRNLNVEIIEVPSSDAILSSLVSDAVNFGIANAITLGVAQEAGLPLGWVSTLVNTPPERRELSSGIYVRGDSGIESWADLNGKRVQISSPGSSFELYIRGAIDNNGGDASTIETVVLPGSEVLAAIERGDVDAGTLSVGYAARATEAGLVKLGEAAIETAASQPLSPFATNTIWADQNKEVVAAFNAAVIETAEYAAAHPDEVRESMVAVFPQQVPTIEDANLLPADFSGCFNHEAVEILVALAQKYEYLPASFDPQDLYFQGLEPNLC